MAKVVTLNSIDPFTFEYQDYSEQDDNLIVNFIVEPTFNPLQNYVAYYIYDLNNNVIFDNEVNFDGYSIIDGQVVLNPEGDVEKAGYEEGQYNVVYNFLNNEISSSFFQRLYIDQISPDRTEIRLNTTQISNIDLINGANSLISQIQSNPGVYFDFFLNFGDNQLVIANNMLLDTSNSEDPTVLIKLYEPLPINFTLKDECWVVTEVANTVAYNINITQTFELADENIYLKGPNLNLNIKDQINNSTAYTNYATLSSSSYATGSNNLQYQVNSILAERGIEINVDYSDYSNFIYFSSALTRLENFYYKLQLIEEYSYSASLSNLAGPSAYVVTSKNIWEEKINEIITTFDGYDYYLYYSSGSTAWPKTNSVYPYNNATTNSVAGLAFIQSQSLVATDYDENNNNALINAIPTYLREDPANAQYELFIEMLGEMFDNIWIYYQDVTEKWNADNRLQYGVSKDIVANVLRDLGLKIYQSSFGSADLYTALLGVTPSGSDFPFPYMTGSLPTPTGFEYINSSISASNIVVPLEDIEKGTYKRLYHNLPMLLKKKGTTVGIQDLITAYGIPSTILRVAEFGGKDKDESNDWDYYKQRYNYALGTGNNPSIFTEWTLNTDWGTSGEVNSLQFRFKLPSSGSSGAVNYAVANPDTVLWSLDDGSNVALVLEYTGSGFTSGSYSGSIIDPYYQYANLWFTADGMVSSASVYLPFFNGDWWSVMVSRTGSDYFTLYAANSIYNGDDGSTIGFIASSSYTDAAGGGNWTQAGINSYFGANGDSISLGGNTYATVSGSYQEIRYYIVGLSSSAFIDWTMNPDSIEGNYLNSAPDQLAFRASLGGELYTGSVSIHPKVTGSWVATSSFASDSNFTLDGNITFIPNVETVYLDQPAAGIKNIVSNKIQVVDMNLPTGSTLSQYRSIQQQPPGGSTYTENLAYTEVAFSPQNEINDDIMDQLGFFNMGEFIGDPRQRFNQDTSYPDLDALRDAYFKKYVSNYDLNDYIRLIKFFDNSLFKMIKDFTPARSSLASGVVVKQTLLERNKYPQPEVTQSIYDYSGSINTAFISGGAGGSVNNLNSLDTNPYYLNNVYGVTQSWQETFIIPSGVVTQTHDSQDEFYNGEFSGSNFVVENGELNEANPTKQVSTVLVNYNVTGSNNTNPSSGEIYWNVGVPGGGPPIGTQFIDELYINEIDNNGLNIQIALSNLNPGDSIIFPIRYDLTPIPPIPTLPINKTVTGIITNINPIGSTIWRIGLTYSTSTDLTYNPLLSTFTFNSSSGNIILNPFLNNIAGFNNSDYNAIINNADFNRLSQWYEEVDYATAQTVPVNFQQIISGTAYPAAVQDSNYTSYQYSGIRYWGSKNTTDNINDASVQLASAIQVDKFPSRIGISQFGQPSIDLNQTYFSYFNWAGGTSPEWGDFKNDRTVYSIRFFVDENGNIIRPLNDPDGIALGIMNQNFTEGQNAVSSLLNTNISSYNTSILNGTYPIFKSGKTIQPILYNQFSVTGSNGNVVGYNFAPSIQFNASVGTTTVSDWSFNVIRVGTQTISRPIGGLTSPQQIQFNVENSDVNNRYSSNEYTFDANTDTNVRFTSVLRVRATNLNIGSQQVVAALEFAIQKSSDLGSTWTNLVTNGNYFPQLVVNGVPSTNSSTGTIFLQTPYLSFDAQDKVRVALISANVNPNEAFNIEILGAPGTINTSTFYNLQEQVPTAPYTASGVFFTTGSTPDNVLTASAELSNLYSLELKQQDITGSGFNSISYPFIPQPQDEIRFEGVEANSYIITEVDYSGSLFLTLNNPITTNTNINQFLIRRYVDDPAFLILDVDKPAGESGGGIIKPEFLLGRVDQRIDQIVQDLEERGLLPT